MRESNISQKYKYIDIQTNSNASILTNTIINIQLIRKDNNLLETK